MQYQFKFRQHKHKTSKILFRSAWFDAPDMLGAIAQKDDYLMEHPEFNNCWVTWEQKEEKQRGKNDNF